MQNYIPISLIISNTNKKFKNRQNIYFIYCYNWQEDDLEKFVEELDAEPIYKSKQNAIRKDERYIVYKLYDKKGE